MAIPFPEIIARYFTPEEAAELTITEREVIAPGYRFRACGDWLEVMEAPPAFWMDVHARYILMDRWHITWDAVVALKAHRYPYESAASVATKPLPNLTFKSPSAEST